MVDKNPSYIIARAAHDSIYATKISNALEKKGWHDYSWEKFSSIKADAEVQREVNSHFDKADFFIFIVPPIEGMGQVALMELGAAMAQKKNIIPILPSNSRLESARPFRHNFNMMNANDLTPNQVADRIIALAS